jgi:hypothetical protein
MLTRHEITGLWRYAAPPAIWRLSGLDRSCLSAITHLTESRHARRRDRLVPDTTIPDHLRLSISAAQQQYDRQQRRIAIG